MGIEYSATLNRYDEEQDRDITLDVIVEYYSTAPSLGARGRFGEPLEPDDMGSLEIECVTDSETGEVIECTEDEIRKIEEKINEGCLVGF